MDRDTRKNPGNFIRLKDKELRRWQDSFAAMAGVYLCCLDSSGEKITDFSGDLLELPTIKKAVDEIHIRNIFQRVTEGELEDQAVERTMIPNLRVAAVAAKLDGQPQLVWIVCAILKDAEYEPDLYTEQPITDFSYITSEKKFYNSLDFLRVTSVALVGALKSENQAAASTAENFKRSEDFKLSFHRAELMTEIVSLLDSDDEIEDIMLNILKKICEYLDISNSFICRMHSEDDLMDIVVQWTGQGVFRLFEEEKDLDPCWFIGHPQMIAVSSSTTMNSGEKEQLQDLGIKAVVSVPIMISDQTPFYACFAETREDNRGKDWLVDDIKFINDSIKILQNIITKRIQKNSIASSFQSLEAVLDNVGSSIYVRCMKTDELLFANRSLRKHFAKELQKNKLKDLFEGNIPPRSHSGNYEIYYDEKDRWYDLYYTRIKWVDDRLVSLCAIYEITEKKIYQKRIEQQAYTDFLTGLFNRLCCERDLVTYIEQAKKKGTKGMLMYLDLDDFKKINDGLGHQYGDILLQDISTAIKNIDGVQNSCYRMGGDEFVIIVPPESYDKLDSILEEIRRAFATPWYLKDGDYYCTMSMGTVEFPTAGDTVEELIRKSDIAMYEAKKSGKNRISQYSESIDASTIRRLDMEKAMYKAVEDGCKEFSVHFQPLMDIKGKNPKVVGAEAFVRWNSAILGAVSPSEFISLAEYLGLINPIGEHVFREAAKCCGKWSKKLRRKISIHVNMSVVQLMQPDIAGKLKTAVEEAGIEPSQMVLDVTEALTMNNTERTKGAMEKISEMGVRLSLDDFGTGYSSINGLRALPFATVKVDRTISSQLEKEEYAKSLIVSLMDLSGAIGASVCVEGVEEKTQIDILKGLKVPLVQGEYFGKPMPAEEFEKKYI
ncbi:diguanylate cyclase (GGDEF) domain-containing protein [Butyrivibrio sp. ob235]|uniref:sensor domain-containing phosphodiesterase n=1 Tax=Butyrivibrio sp. ob235 TaxID=1761780 RepID=UPI0008D02EA8|nr:EAL domain-containing protein [Butyrivibrio sp. ob235]SEK62149.1 diguanylate cyclase (GGDEF) domain-containing protein [Butyrivibrio sp. ob235]